MGLGNLLRNLRDRGITDITNPEVIKAYLEWGEIKKNGITLEADEILSFSEQVVYRTQRCPTCVKNKECTEGARPCHCPMPEKALTPLAECSEKRWPRMMPAEDWETYKKENNIEISVFQP